MKVRIGLLLVTTSPYMFNVFGIWLASTGNGMIKSLLDSIAQPCSPSNAILAVSRRFI